MLSALIRAFYGRMKNAKRKRIERVRLSGTEQWEEPYNNSRRLCMLNHIAIWESSLCISLAWTIPVVCTCALAAIMQGYQNVQAVCSALQVGRCTKYKHAYVHSYFSSLNTYDFTERYRVMLFTPWFQSLLLPWKCY